MLCVRIDGMEVSKISERGIKVKSKVALLGINPVEGRGPFDGILLLERSLLQEKFSTEGNPVVIVGPGEYEIKGVKFNGFEKEQLFIYSGRIDNMRVSFLKSSSLTKIKDIIEGSEIVLIDADMVVDQKSVAALNANVVVLYGPHATESTKVLGKESVTAVPKYTITKEKLPSELDVIVLS